MTLSPSEPESPLISVNGAMLLVICCGVGLVAGLMASECVKDCRRPKPVQNQTLQTMESLLQQYLANGAANGSVNDHQNIASIVRAMRLELSQVLDVNACLSAAAA